MNKLFILLLSALSLTVVAQNQKIALLEPRAGEGSTGISGMEKAMLRGELRKAIVNQPGYEAFTRADIDQLMKEQDFQRTGNVSESDIHKLGEMSGADYVCVSTLNKSNTEFYLEAYLINIETGAISNPASQYGELVNGKLANMLPVCETLARELLGKNNKSSNIPVTSNKTIPSQVRQKNNEEQVKINTSGENDNRGAHGVLWEDLSYSKECRKAGKYAFTVALKSDFNTIYKELKKSGLTGTDLKQKAYDEAMRIATEAGNKAVIECSGE